jgi:hypothetical protein
MATHAFAPVFRSPHADAREEDTADAYHRAYNDALGELYDANALSWSDQYGKRHLYNIRCGRKLGGGRFCFRRADHPEDQCEPRWEFP